MKVFELFESRDVLSLKRDFQDYFEGSFVIKHCKLESLKGSPSKVTLNFNCSSNELTDLEGGPKEVFGNFICEYCDLTSLKGAPKKIGSSLFVGHNNLTSLHNIHKQITHIGNTADFTNNPIKSHVLGLLLIEGLDYVALSSHLTEKNILHKVQDILIKHLQGDRDVFACQEELIEAGLEDYAQL